MQQQELAQIRQRDANLTALAAIGPRKKRKLDSPALGTDAEVTKIALFPFVYISLPFNRQGYLFSLSPGMSQKTVFCVKY